MKLSEIVNVLDSVPSLQFQLPDGSFVPAHFHITEVGQVNKQFIDCGGTIRQEQAITFQLWYSEDRDHRLSPDKLRSIIQLARRELNLGDHEVEVEYQTDTLGKFGLTFEKGIFRLIPKYTDCLAKDQCGVPQEKPKVKLSSTGQPKETGCTPGSGCC